MCASKWINRDLFNDYATSKAEEATTQTNNALRRSEFVWQSPQAGTADKPKVYEGRFLPDQKGKFTRRYMYHMWKSGDKWIFYLCPKTDGMDKFCPVCSVVNSLYSGTQEDKNVAFRMKRKERHVGNFYVVDDPRDKDQDDAAKKASGKVKLYEFPGKLESKLKNEILDKKEGLGYAIFDPGNEGHNIIIKIKSTKPDAKGNTYPDYSDSIFSRKSLALADSDKEIKEIMASTYSIDEYIDSMKMSKEDTIKMLKNEMLWDAIEDEWNRNFGSELKKAKEEVEDVSDFDDEDEKPKTTKKTTKKPKDEDEDETSDEDLLKELRQM